MEKIASKPDTSAPQKRPLKRISIRTGVRAGESDWVHFQGRPAGG